MRLPKRYGASKIDRCPFCDKQAVTSNPQGIPVCSDHKSEDLNDLKCACGDWLDLKKGKYGIFFNCMNCGSVSLSKALDMNPKAQPQPKISASKKTSKPTEVTVTSDDLDFM